MIDHVRFDIDLFNSKSDATSNIDVNIKYLKKEITEKRYEDLLFMRNKRA